MKLTGQYLTEAKIKKRIVCFEYIRLNKQVIGLAVLDRYGRIGWSLYAENEDEEESREKGLLIALTRGRTYTLRHWDMYSDLKGRIDRAEKVTRLIAVRAYVNKMNMRKIKLESKGWSWHIE